MAKLRPITLVDQVIEQLVGMIRKRESTGETELPSISELTTHFGVSRVVVREALKSLEAQGVVQILNGRRARIESTSIRPLVGFLSRAMDFGDTSLEEILSIRRTLEREAAALAAVNRSESELEGMRDIVRRATLHSAEAAALVELDDELRRAVLAASHNAMLYRMARALRDTAHLSASSIDRAATDEEDAQHHARINVQLVGAIARRSSSAARRAMDRHFHALGTVSNVARV